MKQVFNADFQEFIAVMKQYEVAYLLVGGYAVFLHRSPDYRKKSSGMFQRFRRHRKPL